jgi:hypothetical protein
LTVTIQVAHPARSGQGSGAREIFRCGRALRMARLAQHALLCELLDQWRGIDG